MRSLRIGLLLGVRQIQRASYWTTGLIILVMVITFLNLVAVSGILVGLIVGSEKAVRESALGDVVLSPRDDEDVILETPALERVIQTYPEVVAYSVRYEGNAIMEANYTKRRDLSGERDIAAVSVTGIDVAAEDKMTNLSEFVVEGEYLNPNEEGYILVGIYFIEEYAQNFGDSFDTVANVKPGDRVRLTIGDISKEFTVKGLMGSKVDEINFTTFLPEREFRRLFNRLDQNANQIVLRTQEPSLNAGVVEAMKANGLTRFAKIATFEESLPKFLIDIKNTFNVLGTFIGSVGVVVASVTIFIIVFINALSRRKHIGILKGIGIRRQVIEIAYVIQASFYVIVGSALGALLTYGWLVPYFDKNPIQFPFSDGILAADPEGTFWRFVVLLIVTLIAGFIPAWMIARQNTLDSILGRK